MVKADDEVLAMLPWMVRDWLSSRARAVLKHEERSIYRELMDHAWLSPGCVLPDNDAILAALADVTPERWKELRPLFLSLQCFEVTPEGLINTKLRKCWLKARRLRAAKRRAGQKGGQASGKTRRTRSKQRLDSAASKREAEPKPPSPSPSPSHEEGNGNGLAPAAAGASWSAESISDYQELRGEPGQRAGRITRAMKALVDKYQWARVRPVWRRWLVSDEAKFGPESFADNFLALENGGSAPARASPGKPLLGDEAVRQAREAIDEHRARRQG